MGAWSAFPSHLTVRAFRRVPALWLVLAFLAPVAYAQSAQCANRAVEPLARKLVSHFASRQLAALDKERPYADSIQFVIEHSIADGYEVEEAPALAAIEQWLNSQEPEGIPAREGRPLEWCRKGLCVFDLSAGIAHNHRYLQKLTYGYRNGCPYIRSAFLLDGD